MPPIFQLINPMKKLQFLAYSVIMAFDGLAFGASSVYSGPLATSPADGWPLEMVINGNTITPSVSISTPLVNSGMQISVDTTTSTLTYDKLHFQTNSVTDVVSVSKTVGFGLVKDYQISVTINPINLIVSAAGTPLSLTPGSGGLYNIVGSLPQTGSPLTVTGSYIITGPTQTVNGMFSMPVSGSRTIYAPDLLNTSSYPAQLTASVYGGGLYRYFVSPSANNAISRVVDGATVDWDFDYVTFRIPQNTVLKPGVLIPEMATSMLMAVGFASFLISRRRRSTGLF